MFARQSKGNAEINPHFSLSSFILFGQDGGSSQNGGLRFSVNVKNVLRK